MQRVVAQRDVDQVLASLRHGLGDRDRHFASLAKAVTYTARAIAHHGQGGKTKLTAAFDDLRRTIHCDELLDKLITRLALFRSCHTYAFLEFQARFASGLSEGFDTPVVLKTCAIERNLAHTRGLRPLRDSATHRLGGFDVAGPLQSLAYS